MGSRRAVPELRRADGNLIVAIRGELEGCLGVMPGWRCAVNHGERVPTVAVLDDGTVGVSYFDLRNNTPDQLGILANHWLAFCRLACSAPEAWRETSVAGPFDLQRAPYARGFFVGDYMGIAGQGGAFALLYVTTTPPGDPEITAAYFAAVTP